MFEPEFRAEQATFTSIAGRQNKPFYEQNLSKPSPKNTLHGDYFWHQNLFCYTQHSVAFTAGIISQNMNLSDEEMHCEKSKDCGRLSPARILQNSEVSDQATICHN